MPVQLHSHSGEEGDEARIEIIPLIDIMFFLLAAFMLVSLSMTHMRRVAVDVPDATGSEVVVETPPVTIAIDAAGITTWEGEVVSLTDIKQRLESMGVTEETQVMIAADEESRHKQVIAVMGAVKQVGVNKVSFESSN